MTSKQKAIVSAIVAGATGFLAWLANTPDSQQDALLKVLVDCLPIGWRPEIGAIARLLSSLATVYAALHASKSGPATPPANNTITGETIK